MLWSLSPGRVFDMTDPRLNSVHLEPSRREDYRRARARLLQAQGLHTLAGLKVQSSQSGIDSSHTLIPSSAGPPPDLMFWLMDAEGFYPLRMGVNTIGRAAENDVVLKDDFVSRRHCAVLVHADNRCELHDTASKNGTLLNGQKLNGPVLLKTGDEIRVSGSCLVFVARESPPQAPGSLPTLS
jgi:hypothetical protein